MAYILSLFRYLRLIVHIFSHWIYKSVPIPPNPTVTPADVTVVIPTLGDNLDCLSAAIWSHIGAGCNTISVCVPSVPTVKSHQVESLLRGLRKKCDGVQILISKIGRANKRAQLRAAIEAVPKSRRDSHKAIVFADDDITCPHKTLQWMLACLQRETIGAVGTCQQTRRCKDGSFLERITDWILADYIERRNFENATTLGIDGSISCLSGRMMLIRPGIVQDPAFLCEFVSEVWCGRELNADDDNFWTRWVLEGGWEIGFQYDGECQVETTFDLSPKQLLKRNLRWCRSNWRSNWRSIRKPANWQ